MNNNSLLSSMFSQCLQKLVNVQEGMESRGLKPFYMQQEQPLYAHKQQVMLVDPGDK